MEKSVDGGPPAARGSKGAVWGAAAVMALVGLYDAAVGAYMLGSPTPWQAHGPSTIWRGLDQGFGALSLEAQTLTMSMLRRIGAFSLFAGAVSLFVAFSFADKPRFMLRFMVLYMVVGLGFGATDGVYFSGTPYHVVKQVIGGLWAVAALVLWLSVRKGG